MFSLMSETLQLGLPVKLTCVLSFSVCRRATRWESWDTHEMAAYSLSLLQWIISLIQSSLWAVECQTTRLLWLNYKLNSRGHQTNCSLRLFRVNVIARYTKWWHGLMCQCAYLGYHIWNSDRSLKRGGRGEGGSLKCGGREDRDKVFNEPENWKKDGMGKTWNSWKKAFPKMVRFCQGCFQ